ncbi:MAG: peroxidase-related enzyme [Pseudomonadota bacterium]
MPWIKIIPFDAATGRLKQLYTRIAGPGDNVDNIMLAHSLRPHTMEGHMALYKAVLHHRENSVPKWLLELIGVWVSARNGCDYCLDHHFAGLKRLLRDEVRAVAIWDATQRGVLDDLPVGDKERAALVYAGALNDLARQMGETDIAALRQAGWSDAEILEINQVTAYFAYANRTVLGLGCSTRGDIIGLSPGNDDDPDDWGHH